MIRRWNIDDFVDITIHIGADFGLLLQETRSKPMGVQNAPFLHADRYLYVYTRGILYVCTPLHSTTLCWCLDWICYIPVSD